MREVKFRAWDIQNSKMIQWHSSFFGDVVFGLDSDLYIPMQYTGLKDKNGKDIYEGDIVKHPTGVLSQIKYLIQQEKPSGPQNLISYDAPYDYSGFTGISYGGIMEVMGNIYENPELLK